LTKQKKEQRPANIGLPAMAGDEQICKFSPLINFCAWGQVCASKPPLRQAKNRYGQV